LDELDLVAVADRLAGGFDDVGHGCGDGGDLEDDGLASAACGVPGCRAAGEPDGCSERGEDAEATSGHDDSFFLRCFLWCGDAVVRVQRWSSRSEVRWPTAWIMSTQTTMIAIVMYMRASLYSW